ncbi:MAG: hypothetical protein IH861_08920 [Chloroflexi bacterium]|nr:hypothetical protein [Chloroflexota bacterium]
MPQNGAEAKNIKLVSHNDLNGFGNGGEGMAMQTTSDGRRIMYIAHESAPKDFTGVDVTDPKHPKVIVQTDLPHSDVRSNSLDMVDNIMLVAYQTKRPGLTPAGVGVYDMSVPESPKKISFFDTSGPYSRGAHCLWFVDGRYAHVTTGAADFEPYNQKDDQFHMILDLEDPANPREVGRWWLPGTRKGDPGGPIERHTKIDVGFRTHNINVYPDNPDRAYLAYLDGGAIILDISDKSKPKMLGRQDYHPPFPGYTHTMLPLADRGLAVVSDESVTEDGRDHPKLTWVMDIREESNPVIISTFPMPDAEEFIGRGGRFGSHNLHENMPGPNSYRSDRFIIGAYFNAGVRVHDISDPFHPKEAGYYIPPAPVSKEIGVNINDVFVDENGLIYAIERKAGGLYILEMEV